MENIIELRLVNCHADYDTSIFCSVKIDCLCAKELLYRINNLIRFFGHNEILDFNYNGIGNKNTMTIIIDDKMLNDISEVFHINKSKSKFKNKYQLDSSDFIELDLNRIEKRITVRGISRGRYKLMDSK